VCASEASAPGPEPKIARPLQGADDVFVVVPQQPMPSLGLCLLAGLGDVPAQEDTPVLAIDGLAGLFGGSLGEAPLRR